MNPSFISYMEGYQRISFVGGGGKTTLIFRSAELLNHKGKRVVITTTTHMARPGAGMDYENLLAASADLVWISEENIAAVEDALNLGRIVFLGLPDLHHDKKIVGPSHHFLREVQKICDVILVEADGSRRRPIKVPRAWEPAIPEGTDLTVAVAGLSGLGEPLSVCGYEPEDLARFLGKTTESILTTEDVLSIVSSESGLRKNATKDYLVVLNQADTRERRQAAEQILQELNRMGIQGTAVRRQTKLALIILAAGLSRRFHGEKIFAGLPDGPTFLETTLKRSETLSVNERILVYRHPESEEMACRRPVPWKAVKNEHPEQGISGSLQLGLQAASQDVDGWMFCVCDQPNLTSDYMEQLIHVWKEKDADIVSAAYHQKSGNPKIFSRTMKSELEELTGDSGGREILKNYWEQVYFVEAPGRLELLDVDTGEDLIRWKSLQK